MARPRRKRKNPWKQGPQPIDPALEPRIKAEVLSILVMLARRGVAGLDGVWVNVYVDPARKWFQVASLRSKQTGELVFGPERN